MSYSYFCKSEQRSLKGQRSHSCREHSPHLCKQKCHQHVHKGRPLDCPILVQLINNLALFKSHFIILQLNISNYQSSENTDILFNIHFNITQLNTSPPGWSYVLFYAQCLAQYLKQRPAMCYLVTEQFNFSGS